MNIDLATLHRLRDNPEQTADLDAPGILKAFRDLVLCGRGPGDQTFDDVEHELRFRLDAYRSNWLEQPYREEP